jgi:hypothetical protein
LETELRVGTADNDINALKNNGSIPEGYTINHFLTDNNAWFLTTDVPNGMKHFVRTPLAQSMDGDFDTGNVRYKARERYSFGWSDPLGMFASAPFSFSCCVIRLDRASVTEIKLALQKSSGNLMFDGHSNILTPLLRSSIKAVIPGIPVR